MVETVAAMHRDAMVSAMTTDRLGTAINRLETALDRLERAVAGTARRAAAIQSESQELAARHDRLRDQLRSAIDRIDTLIEATES